MNTPSPAQAESVVGISVRVPSTILSSVGARIAQSAVLLQKEAGLSTNAKDILVELEALGLELQELVHGLDVPTWRNAEPVNLLCALQRAHGLWLPELARRGSIMHVTGKPITVRINPALLQQAIDLLIEHASSGAGHFTLETDSLQTEGPALLRMTSTAKEALPHELHWQLLRLVARAHGWMLQHEPSMSSVGPPTQRMSCQFGATKAFASTEGLPRARIPPHARILIIDHDEFTRLYAAQLIEAVGARADCVSNIHQARLALNDGDPVAVITGVSVDDPEAHEFFEDLRERLPHLALIELVDQAFVFSTSAPQGDAPARIARQDLANTLVWSLGQEISLSA
ncbi:MAG: hypothetical protein ACKOF9_14375 [Burkholderiales bacterium]